jgi:CRP/FNR family transcriptional regulator
MNTENPPKINISSSSLKLACSNCSLHELCMPVGLSPDLFEMLDKQIYIRRHIKTGAALYHSGNQFNSLYAIKRGFFKTETLTEDGRVQITGFHMMGEILGFDGIDHEKHMCTSIALEDSEVCLIPLEKIEKTPELHVIQHHFYQLMSREIFQDHTMMMLLGSMQGEERLVAFILSLSRRYEARGYSPLEFVLRMKREEIGSYLGMKLETVSRALTKLHSEGVLHVQQKTIRILDMERLRKIIGTSLSK